MSFPWKIPLTTAMLWVLTRDQLLRCHVSCRLNCRLRSKWMSFFILTEWERLLNQSYTSLCVVPSTSMTGNSSILNFLIVGFLRGSFLTRTTVSQVCRAMWKENCTCKLKAGYTKKYVNVHASRSQNKNKAKQQGSSSWLREGKVESQNEHILLSVNNNGGVCFLFLLEIPVLYA